MADFKPTFPINPNIRPVANNLNCAVNTITRYDMEFIKAYNDKELLHALCYQIANVIDMLNLTQEQFEKLVLWVNSKLEEYTSNKLEEWLKSGVLESIIKELIETQYDSYVENYESVVSNKIKTYGYEELKKEIDIFKVKYKDMCTFITVGKSYLKRDIYLIVLGNISADNKCLIVGNQHAREIHTTQLIMKQLEFICENWNRNYNGEKTSDIFKNTAYFIIPNINPDGTELVLRGIDSVPLDTPDYNNLINNIKNAVTYKFRNNIKKNSDVDESWDLYPDIQWNGNIGKIPNYAFRNNDTFIWKSNLQGIDLYYNTWEDDVNRVAYNSSLSSGSITQGKYRSEGDMGNVGFGATENIILLNIIKTYNIRKYSIMYHGRTPVLSWNYSLNGEVLNRSKHIIESFGKVVSTHPSVNISNRMGTCGYMYSYQELNAPLSEYAKTNSFVTEIGYLRFPPINEDNGEYINTAPYMASPLSNEQEPYIWKFNKYGMISYNFWVREKDNNIIYDNISVLTMAKHNSTPTLRGLDESGHADNNLYAGSYSTREGNWRKIGNMIYLNYKIVISSRGTLNSTSNGVALEISGLPKHDNTSSSYGICSNVSNLDFPLSDKNGAKIIGIINPNSNLIILYAENSSGGRLRLRQSDIKEKFGFQLSLFYSCEF